MSNFNCEKCGLPILEDENGEYFTACSHYPLEALNKTEMTTITVFEFPPIIIDKVVKTILVACLFFSMLGCSEYLEKEKKEFKASLPKVDSRFSCEYIQITHFEQGYFCKDNKTHKCYFAIHNASMIEVSCEGR